MFETGDWIMAWYLNAAKTTFISFTSTANSTYFTYKLNNIHIAHPQFVKDLGVLLDTKLHFQNHVDHVVAQALKTLGLIRYNTPCFLPLTVNSVLFPCTVWTWIRLCNLEFCYTDDSSKS